MGFLEVKAGPTSQHPGIILGWEVLVCIRLLLIVYRCWSHLPLSGFLLLTLGKRGPGQMDQTPIISNSNITSQRPRTRQLYFQSLIIFRSFDLRHIVVFRSRKNHKPIVCPGHPEKHNL